MSKFETCLLTCRLRIFNQLDEELNSHQHELQWLMDKAKQIAQKDITLAPETDKEINRLESLWKDTKKAINEKYVDLYLKIRKEKMGKEIVPTCNIFLLY